MRTFRFIVPALVVMGGLLVNMTPTFAKPEDAKKTKKGCVTCHVTAKSKDLNDVGKCYKDKKALDGCEAKK